MFYWILITLSDTPMATLIVSCAKRKDIPVISAYNLSNCLQPVKPNLAWIECLHNGRAVLITNCWVDNKLWFGVYRAVDLRITRNKSIFRPCFLFFVWTQLRQRRRELESELFISWIATCKTYQQNAAPGDIFVRFHAQIYRNCFHWSWLWFVWTCRGSPRFQDRNYQWIGIKQM